MVGVKNMIWPVSGKSDSVISRCHCVQAICDFILPVISLILIAWNKGENVHKI